VTPLYIAAEKGHVAVVRCLVKELGADVNQAANDGTTPLYFAAAKGDLAVAQLLVEELGADVNQGLHDGATPLYIAAQEGHLAMVRCLVKKLGADVNRARHNGGTPLMIAASAKQDNVVAFLLKYGANPQLCSPNYGTAANVSKSWGASIEQTEYLEARTHCAMPGCSGAGAKKCAGCLHVYYCKRECQLMHWPTHKADCKRSAEVAKK
jgi:ankyrin repeat protein